MRFFSVLLISILIPVSVVSQLINIPADYPGIQQGIEAAQPGDTVLVAPGEYVENLNLLGKDLVLCSNYALSGLPEDILNTIINGSSPSDPDTASCILIINGETAACVIQGFTITGGGGTVWEDEHGPGNFYREGGGILIQYAAPTIKNNRFIGNEATNNENVVSAGGGAIRCGDSNPLILNNTFLYNLARYGAGIVLNYSDATIKNNILAFNAGGEDYGGGGIWSVSNGDEPIVIENNTLVYNHSNQVGGGIRLWSSLASITNNILWGNTALNYSQIAGGNNLTYNCIQNGFSGEGNISDAPDFLDDTYILSETSPCIDAGNPDPGFNDPEDMTNPGLAAYPAMGSLHNDMGVYGGPNSMLVTTIMTNQSNHVLNRNYGIHVFPNPVNTTLHVHIRPSKGRYVVATLFDSRMCKIDETTTILQPGIKHKLSFNLNGLDAGMYIMTVVCDNDRFTRKIIKL